MYLLVNVNLDIFAGRSGKINFFKDSKGTQTHGYILIDNTSANANMTSTLTFANTSDTTNGAIKVSSTGTGANLLSTMQINDINSLNITGLRTLATSQVGTPLIIDSNNNIVKGNSYYALYITGDSISSSKLKVFRMSNGEADTFSGPGANYSKAYYLFSHLTPSVNSTFTPNWVGADPNTKRNDVVSKSYLKFYCLGYWFISFSVYEGTGGKYFRIITMFKNMKIGE